MLNHTAIRMAAALLSGAAATFTATAPAIAQERPVIVYGEGQSMRTERIAFADLALDSVSGRKSLQQRVDGAIERVCDREVGRDGLQLRGYYACANQARADAEPQIELAVQRTKEMALFGSSSIAATAIVISAR